MGPRSSETGISLTDPGDLDVALEGVAGDLIAAIMRLEGFDFALVGGLAVMVRLGGAHRVTNDLDGVFDNPEEDTAATLVTAGVAEAAGDAAGIVIDGKKLEVIDTQPLPDVVEDVAPDPGDRLFLCAHRYPYEAATSLLVASAGATATIRVATPAALVASLASPRGTGSTGGGRLRRRCGRSRTRWPAGHRQLERAQPERLERLLRGLGHRWPQTNASVEKVRSDFDPPHDVIDVVDHGDPRAARHGVRPGLIHQASHEEETLAMAHSVLCLKARAPQRPEGAREPGAGRRRATPGLG